MKCRQHCTDLHYNSESWSLLSLLQRVLLQPPQPGARLLPAQEDGCAGLPARVADRQLPPGAGSDHGHQPHHGGRSQTACQRSWGSLRLSHASLMKSQLRGCWSSKCQIDCDELTRTVFTGQTNKTTTLKSFGRVTVWIPTLNTSVWPQTASSVKSQSLWRSNLTSSSCLDQFIVSLL